MKNILLTYSTLGGATESLTKDLFSLLVDEYSLIKFEIDGVEKLDPTNLSKFDLIIFGASTYDEDMNFDAMQFFLNLEKSKKDLSGVKFYLFGIGDRAYSDFCGAIDKIGEKIIVNKGEVLTENLKLEAYPVPEALDTLKKWAESFIEI